MTFDFSHLGYDFGIRPTFIYLSDPTFSDLFVKAKCHGIAYFRDKENVFPVQISFIFQNEKEAEELFDIFFHWINDDPTNGDAVDMEFIENNEGGYTVAIAPEMDALIKRMVPINLKNRVTPLTITTTHFTNIDTLGNNYSNFKTNYKKVVDGIRVGYVIGDTSGILKNSKKFFVKKQFNFYQENTIPKNTIAAGYKASKHISEAKPQDISRPTKDTLEEIALRRISELKELLPFTMHKLDNLWLGAIQEGLNQKHDSFLIKQAICNLTIFERIKQVPGLIKDFNNENSSVKILEYLTSTYESFDSYYPPNEFYSLGRITAQIENDNKTLNNYLNP